MAAAQPHHHFHLRVPACCHGTTGVPLWRRQRHGKKLGESIPSPPPRFLFKRRRRRRGGGAAAAAALPRSCLAGGRQQVQQARQIYGAGGDLWGRNTVMGEWLSTVSYWHLTKCPKQNEFTSLFLNHQAATALTPILTAITRSPISQGPEKFTVTSTFQ